jgi:hypothetical protein
MAQRSALQTLNPNQISNRPSTSGLMSGAQRQQKPLETNRRQTFAQSRALSFVAPSNNPRNSILVPNDRRKSQGSRNNIALLNTVTTVNSSSNSGRKSSVGFRSVFSCYLNSHHNCSEESFSDYSQDEFDPNILIDVAQVLWNTKPRLVDDQILEISKTRHFKHNVFILWSNSS